MRLISLSVRKKLVIRLLLCVDSTGSRPTSSHRDLSLRSNSAFIVSFSTRRQMKCVASTWYLFFIWRVLRLHHDILITHHLLMYTTMRQLNVGSIELLNRFNFSRHIRMACTVCCVDLALSLLETALNVQCFQREICASCEFTTMHVYPITTSYFSIIEQY